MSESPPAGSMPSIKGRRWLGPALLVSLVVNLVLLGMIATALVFHRPPSGPEFGPVPSPFFRSLQKDGAGLGHDDRAVIRRIMIQEFPAIRPYIARIEAARKELADAVGATPYDPARVVAAFEKIDLAQAEMTRATRDAMVTGFGKLDPAQRRRLAEAMRRRAEHRMNRTGERGEPPHPGPPDDDMPPPPDEPGH